MVRDMRSRHNPRTGPPSKEPDKSVPPSPTKSSTKGSQASHQTPDPSAESIIPAKSPESPTLPQPPLPTANLEDDTANVQCESPHTISKPVGPHAMTISRSGTDGGILIITGLPKSFLNSLKDNAEAPVPLKSKRGRKRKQPLLDESQKENTPPFKRFRGESAEETIRQIVEQDIFGQETPAKVNASQQGEEDARNSDDVEVVGDAEEEEEPAAATENHQQANAGSPSPIRPHSTVTKDKVDLAKVVLPGPYVEREEIPNEDNLDPASFIYHKEYAPLPSIKSFTDIWNGQDLSEVPTNVLYKLAEGTQKVLTTWQDEYIKLDSFTAGNFNPPKKPATGGRIPAERWLWQQEKETLWWGCPAGLEGALVKGDKKWRKDNAAHLAGAEDGNMTGSFDVNGKKLRRRTGEVPNLLAAGKNDSETTEKRTRKPAKKFDQGTNAEAATGVRKKRGRPPARAKAAQTAENAKATAAPSFDGEQEPENTDPTNQALPKKRGRPPQAPARTASAASTNSTKPKAAARKPRAKPQKAEPAPPAPAPDPDPVHEPTTTTSSYPPHPSRPPLGYKTDAAFVSPPLHLQHTYPPPPPPQQQPQHPPHHTLHSYAQQPFGPAPPSPAAGGSYSQQPQPHPQRYGQPPGPRFYDPEYAEAPRSYQPLHLTFSGGHQQQHHR